MAKMNVWIDQLRKTGIEANAVHKLVKRIESQGVDIKLCYKDPTVLVWLAQAVEQDSVFRRWWSVFLALAVLTTSLGVIVYDWLILL